MLENPKVLVAAYPISSQGYPYIMSDNYSETDRRVLLLTVVQIPS